MKLKKMLQDHVSCNVTLARNDQDTIRSVIEPHIMISCSPHQNIQNQIPITVASASQKFQNEDLSVQYIVSNQSRLLPLHSNMQGASVQVISQDHVDLSQNQVDLSRFITQQIDIAESEALDSLDQPPQLVVEDAQTLSESSISPTTTSDSRQEPVDTVNQSEPFPSTSKSQNDATNSDIRTTSSASQSTSNTDGDSKLNRGTQSLVTSNSPPQAGKQIQSPMFNVTKSQSLITPSDSRTLSTSGDTPSHSGDSQSHFIITSSETLARSQVSSNIVNPAQYFGVPSESFSITSGPSLSQSFVSPGRVKIEPGARQATPRTVYPVDLVEIRSPPQAFPEDLTLTKSSAGGGEAVGGEAVGGGIKADLVHNVRLVKRNERIEEDRECDLKRRKRSSARSLSDKLEAIKRKMNEDKKTDQFLDSYRAGTTL